jgi:hypothetical protein
MFRAEYQRSNIEKGNVPVRIDSSLHQQLKRTVVKLENGVLHIDLHQLNLLSIFYHLPHSDTDIRLVKSLLLLVRAPFAYYLGQF